MVRPDEHTEPRTSPRDDSSSDDCQRRADSDGECGLMHKLRIARVIMQPVAWRGPCVAGASVGEAHAPLHSHTHDRCARCLCCLRVLGSMLVVLLLGICQMFEEKLKRENPQQKKITYDISDLFLFIDKLTDLAALVYETRAQWRGTVTGSATQPRGS